MRAAGTTLTLGELREALREATHGRVATGTNLAPLYVADGEAEHAVTGVEARSGGGWLLTITPAPRVDEDVAEFLRDLAAGGWAASAARDEARCLVKSLGL